MSIHQPIGRPAVRDILFQQYQINPSKIKVNCIHDSALFVKVDQYVVLFIKSTFLTHILRKEYVRKPVEMLTKNIGHPGKILKKVKQLEDLDLLYANIVCAAWICQYSGTGKDRTLSLTRLRNRWMPSAELKHGVAYTIGTFTLRIHEPHATSYGS